MATIIGKVTGSIATAITKAQTAISPITQGPANKLWRALILLNRQTSPMPKAADLSRKSGLAADLLNLHYAQEDSFSESQANDPWYGRKVSNVRSGQDKNNFDPWKKDYTQGKQLTTSTIHNDIIIVNRNVSPAISLVLQNRPNEIAIEPQTAWAKVKSMGRNNPFLMYTGGEDTVTLQISWYAVDEVHRDDVVNKCRLLESWSKANGYNNSPPTLEIIWGSSGLFEDDSFILERAPYNLTHFQNAMKRVRTMEEREQGLADDQIDLGLLPNMATQTLIFNRVTDNNRTHEDIIPASKLAYTPGITFDKAE